MFLKLRSTQMPELIILETCSMWLWKLRPLSKTSPKNLTLSDVQLRLPQIQAESSVTVSLVISSVFSE